jgi:antitoxin component of RelBE/YafQ-DinJ toxin-antitoxin module
VTVENKTEYIQFRAEPSLMDAARSLAKRLNMTLSRMIRVAILDYVTKHDGQNPNQSIRA